MILPIKLTDQNGMFVGSGVPSFVINPVTGLPFDTGLAARGISVVDPATGEPATAESNTDTSGDFSNDTGLWDTSAPDSSADVLQTGALRDTRGTQWNRRGSYRTESGFDKWRKAGKPTACSMRGLRGSTFPDGTPCDPGMSDPRLCLSTGERILTAIASGASAAAQPYYPNYAQPYYGGSQPGGSVTVSGGGSSMAWIFGGLIVVGLAYVAMKR